MMSLGESTRRRWLCLWWSALALPGLGCGGSPGGDGDDGRADGGATVADGGLVVSDGGYPGVGDDLDTASGCAGIYNPDQILDLHLTMSGGDWSTVQNDCTFTTYVPATLQCGDGPSIQVGVRHKRSGGTAKPGLKIDINEFVAGQQFNGLKKMSLENGVGSSDGCGDDGGEVSSLFAEYLAWRLHAVSGAITGRAAFARVFVNGEELGVYVNVEQVDKSFLERQVGDDSGWLWKFSGSADDGQKTNEGTVDPYDDYFCFFAKNGCAVPAPEALAAELPSKLDIPQILTVGAVNAISANSDAPIFKLNNHIYYDYAGGPRLYFPWDLDTTLKATDYDVFTGQPGGGVTTAYTDVLFSNWEQDYVTILDGLLTGPLALAAIEAEIDRALEVAGEALDQDASLSGSAADAAAGIRAFWQARHPHVIDQVATH